MNPYYNAPYAQQYPQQPHGAYPQQQGYPGQPTNPAYPQQQGYPSQQYPQQPGYPQQQGYPGQQYPQQAGYPQQPPGAYPPQQGYPGQPNTAYPQQQGYPGQPTNPAYPPQQGYPGQPTNPAYPQQPPPGAYPPNQAGYAPPSGAPQVPIPNQGQAGYPSQPSYPFQAPPQTGYSPQGQQAHPQQPQQPTVVNTAAQGYPPANQAPSSGGLPPAPSPQQLEVKTDDLEQAFAKVVEEVQTLSTQKQQEYDTTMASVLGTNADGAAIMRACQPIEDKYAPLISQRERERQRISVEKTLVDCVMKGLPNFPEPARPNATAQANHILSLYRLAYVELVRNYCRELSPHFQDVLYGEPAAAAKGQLMVKQIGDQNEQRLKQNVAYLEPFCASLGLKPAVINQAGIQQAVQEAIAAEQRALQQAVVDIQQRAQTSQMFHELNRKIISAMPTGRSTTSDGWVIDQYGTKLHRV